ncbi:hypothetical protein [Mycoplasma phocimorsus]|uniref:hypothetical protein n=1 Tax=Mycoplasma phocimorsus TaxID=3045839 RepID=UPI0024C0D4DC|nr:hypothetical protein [Mycoplasma phocimorsus]MDJ1646649.1 hypothetical protein [Mycoplasma phocimorsus]
MSLKWQIGEIIKNIKKWGIFLIFPFIALTSISCQIQVINKDKLNKLNYELNKLKQEQIENNFLLQLNNNNLSKQENNYENIIREINDESKFELEKINQIENNFIAKKNEIILKIPFQLKEFERLKNSEIISELNQRCFEGYKVKEIWLKNNHEIQQLTKQDLLQIKNNEAFELDKKLLIKKSNSNIELILKLKKLVEVKFKIFDKLIQKNTYLEEDGTININSLLTINDLSKKDLGNKYEPEDFITDSLKWKFQNQEIAFDGQFSKIKLSNDTQKPVIISANPKLTRYKRFYSQRCAALSSLKSIQRMLIGILEDDELIKNEIEKSQEKDSSIKKIFSKIGIYALSWTEARELVPMFNFLFDTIYLIINGSLGGKMSFDELSEYMIRLKDSAASVIISLIPAANDGKHIWEWNWKKFAWEAEDEKGLFLKWDYAKCKYIYPELNEKAKIIRSGINSALSILNSGIIHILNTFKNGIIKHELIEDWNNSELPYIVIKDVIYSILSFIADSSYSVIKTINDVMIKAKISKEISQDKIKAISKLLKALIGDNKNKTKKEGALKTIIDVIITTITKEITSSQAISTLTLIVDPILDTIESSMILLKNQIPKSMKIARGVIDLLTTTISISSSTFNKTREAIDIFSTISKQIDKNSSFSTITNSFLSQIISK